MFGLPFGVVVESSVSVLLAVSIGYSVVLNQRLKRLHADRDAMRKMITDLVTATDLANAAVKELKTTAVETDLSLTSRLEEAERFGVQLANHVAAGHEVIQKIIRITTAAQQPRPVQDEEEPEIEIAPTKLQSALAQLAARDRMRSEAA